MRFDLLGFVLCGGSVVSLVVGLGLIESSGLVSVALIALGIALGFGLVFWEQRRDNPLIPISLFGRRDFAVGNGVMVLAAVAFAALLFLVPLARQQMQGESALVSGLVLVPHALGILLATPVAARLTERIGARITLAIGMALTAVTSFVAAFTLSGSPYETGVSLFFGGIGFGLCVVPLQTAPFIGLDSTHIGLGTPVLSLARQIGSAFGPAIATVTVSIVVGSTLGASGYGIALTVAAAFALAGAALALMLSGPRGEVESASGHRRAAATRAG